MQAVALLLSVLAPLSPTCGHPSSSEAVQAGSTTLPHVFQNGERFALKLFWIDNQGKRVDQGVIEPGALISVNTFPGHVFELTNAAGRCVAVVRISERPAGTYVGTSRYRAVSVHPGWQVFIDQALDPDAHPAKAALSIIGKMLGEVDRSLPPAAAAYVRQTPIFLHEHAGPSEMYHHDPYWLVAHGRTVELLNGVEVSDASLFINSSRVQPGAILHELAHAYYLRLPKEDRNEIQSVYQNAMQKVGYKNVKRHDDSTIDAYARVNAAEYFAELTEAYFSRNDFYPFNRSELAAYDPDGERLITKIWH